MRGQNRKVMKNKRKNKFMRNSIYFHRSLAIRVEKKQNTRNLLSHALAFLLSSKSQIHHRQWHSGRSSLSLSRFLLSLSLSQLASCNCTPLLGFFWTKVSTNFNRHGERNGGRCKLRRRSIGEHEHRWHRQSFSSSRQRDSYPQGSISLLFFYNFFFQFSSCVTLSS
jgi:hypothetical protein